MTDIQFGGLPQSLRGFSISPWAAALKERPGEWAKIQTYSNAGTASKAANNIRKGIVSAYRPAGSFEATIRGCDLWARYVGDES